MANLVEGSESAGPVADSASGTPTARRIAHNVHVIGVHVFGNP
jgi:hypothetical protein